MTSKDTSFYPYKCSNGASAFISSDPRHKSVVRGIMTPIDTPPNTHEVNSQQIRTGFDTFKTGFYSDYKDIQNGDISYWYHPHDNSSLSNTFKRIETDTYVDPMGNTSHLLKSNCDSTSTFNLDSNVPEWLKDDERHRNDLMFSSVRKRLQNSWKL